MYIAFFVKEGGINWKETQLAFRDWKSMHAQIVACGFERMYHGSYYNVVHLDVNCFNVRRWPREVQRPITPTDHYWPFWIIATIVLLPQPAPIFCKRKILRIVDIRGGLRCHQNYIFQRLCFFEMFDDHLWSERIEIFLYLRAISWLGLVYRYHHLVKYSRLYDDHQSGACYSKEVFLISKWEF